MDQRLPSGQPPDKAPPTAPSGVANVKQTPEKLSHLETKQESKLENASLVSRLQQDAVSAGGISRRNGDIDVTSDELIKGKQTSYSHVEPHKGIVTTVSKTELDSKKPSSPKKSDSHKITSIQFAELPLEASISNTRSLRDPDMKSDLQRSSTVPEISLRKEPSEEPATVATKANADIANIGGSSTLIDWNSDNRTLYHNVEMRSVGNLAIHSTIEEEPGHRSDKWDDKNEVRSKETPLSKSETRTVNTTTVSVNGSETLPSKCEVSLTQTASPSHVTVTFPKEISKPEISVNKIEKVSDSVAKSSLTDGPITKLEKVPIILDQAPKSKEPIETPLIKKEGKITSGAAEGLQKTQKSDELCQQKVQEAVKDTTSKEKPISPALPHDKKAADTTKIHLGHEKDVDKDVDKRTLDKTITVSEGSTKKEQATLGDSSRGIEIEKTIDKTKDDKMFKLEKQTEGLSKTIAAIDQTKTHILSSTLDTKDQKKSDFVASKKESSLSLAEELKSELPFPSTLDTIEKAEEAQEKVIEKLPPSETRDDTLKPQLIEDKKKSIEPSPPDGKLSGPLTDSIAQKCDSSMKGAESKQIKDTFNLEQKNSKSGLSNDVHKEACSSAKEKGILESESVKTEKDDAAASNKVPLPGVDASTAKLAISQDSLDDKKKVAGDDIAKTEVKGISMIKAEPTKETSGLRYSPITNKMEETVKDSGTKEAQKVHDIIEHELNKSNLQVKDKVTAMKLDSTEQKSLQEINASKLTHSDQDINKKDKPDESCTSNSSQVSKDISIKSKEPDLTQVTVSQPVTMPQKKEQLNTKDISVEKKQETATSVEATSELALKEIAPKAKPLTETLLHLEKAPLHPEAVVHKNGAMAASPVKLFVDEIKERKEPENFSVVAPTKDAPPEKKTEFQPQPVASEKGAMPTSPSPLVKSKDALQESASIEKTEGIKPPLLTTDEKQNIRQQIEESPKRNGSVFQVISNDKTAPEIQRAIEKEADAKISHHLPEEKEKPISFISNFSSGISGTAGKLKTETPKEQAKQPPSKDQKVLHDPCLSKKDEIDSVNGEEKVTTFEKEEASLSTAHVSVETKKLQDGKPESIKKDETFIPPDAKVPEKISSQTEETASLPSHAPSLEKESTKVVSEPKRDKATGVVDKDVPSTSAPSKEPVTLKTQSKDKKYSEMPKHEKDILKETTVIQASVDTSKPTEVPLDSLAVSGETKLKETPAKDEEIKQPETKEPSIYSADKDNILQHKRIESIVSKDNIQQCKTDSKEIEPKKEQPSITKDQKEDTLEKKQFEPPEKLTDDTVRKDKDISKEPTKAVSHEPTKEDISKPEAPKETVLPKTTTPNIISEPSMKVAPEVSSLASRDKDISLPCITDDKINSTLVPSATQEESNGDGAKEAKANEERPIQVPKESVQEKTILDGDKLDKEITSIDQSSGDKGDVEKKNSLDENIKADEDTNSKQNVVNDRKTLPITVNGLVPHIGGAEKVELPESNEDKLDEKSLQKTEEKLEEALKETSEVSMDSTTIMEPQDIVDEQKQIGSIEETSDVSDSKDSQQNITLDKTTQEAVTDNKEPMDTKDAEQQDIVEKDTQMESIIDSSDKIKKEEVVSPKKKKSITKSGEIKGVRSVSPHKQNGQVRRRLHKRSESRDKPEISNILAKQDNKESEKEENEEEKPTRDATQKSPKKRRLRRAHRSAEEKDTSSVPDSAKIPESPVKKPSTAPTKGLTSPKKTPYSRNGLLSPTKSLKGDKKLPPIKAAVGFAPNPNLKNIKSKIGSFDNIHYKPKGGDKKVITAKKLEWNASPKVKSLENTNYRPGGGDKKIITQKLDFKEKAEAKVGTRNLKYGTAFKIEVAKEESKKDSNEDDAPTTEAQESKEPDSVDATGETSEDQELTA